ncbi:hypothetical protein [Chakrabartyella piscis]|uniref:hypothetical protein n=1 Tax=Chakrabartyella piscis TaxID=2918914 RepID=UPI002958548F|nr:hypothetical protein [Chakrabartyella piscis]
MKKLLYPLILILICSCFGCGSKEETTEVADATEESPILQVQILDDLQADFYITDAYFAEGDTDSEWQISMDEAFTVMLNYDEDDDIGNPSSYLYARENLSEDSYSLSILADVAYEVVGNDLLLHVDFDAGLEWDWDVDTSVYRGFSFYEVSSYDLYMREPVNGHTSYVYDASEVVVGGFTAVEYTGSFAYPEILPRVPEDDIYFTPLGDDYAYYVESQEDMPSYTTDNLHAYLIDFDENSNVSRMVLRSPNYNGNIDADGVCTEYFYEEVEFDKYMLEVDAIGGATFITDKEALRTYSMQNFVSGYMSKPEISEFSFVCNNDVNDFQLLDYYTPATDDYFVQEFFYSTTQSISAALHAIVLEFDTDGSTMNRVSLAMLPEENKEEIAIADAYWITLDAENHVYQYPNNTYIYGLGVSNQFKQSKQVLTLSMVNGSQHDNYGQSMAQGGGVQAFSKPYFTEDQLALYNQSIATGVWVNALIFETHYDDKMTYTIHDNVDPNAYQKWIIAYEDGISCSSYNIYQFSGGTAFDNAAGLTGNKKVYNERDLVYHQDIYFSYDSKYGLSKEEVEAVMQAEVDEYGLSLVSIEEGGVPAIATADNYIKCVQVPYPTEATLASFVPEDSTPTGDGIYASGIAEFDGDDLYFTPLTDDWEIEFDQKYPDNGYLYSYDDDGNIIQKLERYVTEAEFRVNSGPSEVFAPEDYVEDTYINVGNAYYFNRTFSSSRTYGGFSTKQGKIKYLAENYDQYDHYFSKPEIDMEQSRLDMYCDTSDFKTLEYATPTTDDYRIAEQNITPSIYYNQTDTLRFFSCVWGTVVSYDTSGTPVDIQRIYLFDSESEAKDYTTLMDPKTGEWIYMDEQYDNYDRYGNIVVMKNEATVNLDEQQWFDPAQEEYSKYEAVTYFATFDGYQDAVSQDNPAVWFSKPYLTEEQM